MKTYKQRKVAICRDLRERYGKKFVVRKSWHYAMTQCRDCRKVFQVGFHEPALSWALAALDAHKCGAPLKGYQKISQG